MSTKDNPPHYKRGTIEPFQIIADWDLDYYWGSVLKYMCRAGHKVGEDELDDVRKAIAFLKEKEKRMLAKRGKKQAPNVSIDKTGLVTIEKHQGKAWKPIGGWNPHDA